jgi:PAS domain S-box-containing protein
MTTSEPNTFRLLREEPEETGHGWPLAFVIIALLALGLVPLWVGRQVAEVEREIEQVIEPARQQALSLALVHAREIARFKTYLMTGDQASLAFYLEAQASEQSAYDSLTALADRMVVDDDTTDAALFDVRNEVAALSAASDTWHALHASALAGPEARIAYFQSALGQEQLGDEQLLAASRNLTDAISAAAEQGRARVDRVRDVQLWLTIALVVVALAASALVAGIGTRLRTLVAETREQRAAAVRTSREIDAILEATGDAVLVLSRDGRCGALNRAGARLLGCDPEHLHGGDVHAMLHGDGGESPHPRGECPLVRAAQDSATVRDEQDGFRRADGSLIPVQWSMGPLEDGLRIKGAVLTFTDMSAIRAAQEALQQAVSARDEVVAVVSHDLRNPLGTIAAAAGLMLELELPEEQRREHLQIIVRATERMNTLMRDLLDIARIEGGGLSVDPQAVDVAELVAEALDLMRPLVVDRGLELSHAVAPSLPRVWADRDRVLQVLSNLIGNALKFTRQGGVHVDVAHDPQRDEVVFSVQDSGPGITPEGLSHLFDRFWQQSRSDRQGAGLGLAIVHGIVTAHGGRIWVESRLGEGSTFRFTLPRARERAGAQTPASAGVAG